MKKFKNIFLAFAAISALSLAFVSCSDDSDDDDSSSSNTTEKQETGGEGTGGSGGLVSAGTIDAAWDFTGTDKYNLGTTENDTAIKDVDLDPTSGTGATLHVDYVKAKFKSEESGSGWYIGKGSAYKAGDNSKAKAIFTLTLTDTATVEIVTTGNGNTDPEKRWCYFLASDGSEISGANAATDLSSDNADTTLSNTVEAGTYQIWMSGNRLYSISVK